MLGPELATRTEPRNFSAHASSPQKGSLTFHKGNYMLCHMLKIWRPSQGGYRYCAVVKLLSDVCAFPRLWLGAGDWVPDCDRNSFESVGSRQAVSAGPQYFLYPRSLFLLPFGPQFIYGCSRHTGRRCSTLDQEGRG